MLGEITQERAIGEERFGDGFSVKWFFDPKTASPRTWGGNLSHFYTWTPRYESPDENPYRSPEEFLSSMLEKHFTPGELREAARSGVLRPPIPASGIAADGKALAGAAELLARKVALKTVYLLDYSEIAYSTAPFRGKWDSGAVGFIYADGEDARRCYGEDAPPRGKLESQLAEDVEVYSDWAAGRCYAVALCFKGSMLDWSRGYVGEKELEAGIASMRARGREAPGRHGLCWDLLLRLLESGSEAGGGMGGGAPAFSLEHSGEGEGFF